MSEGPSQEDPSLGPVDEPDESVPTRVCPHCATMTRTSGDFCPHCGKPYSESSAKEPRSSRRARFVALGVVVVLVLAGGAAAYLINHHNEEQTKKKHQAALRLERQRKETEREKGERETRQHEQEVSERKSAESELEKGVETYAKKLVSEGTLQEPVTGASCNPVSGGSSSDLTTSSGTFSCIAITKHEASGGFYGYHFSGTIDFATGKFSYRLGGGE